MAQDKKQTQNSDTAKMNTARQQETKVSKTSTGAGETSRSVSDQKDIGQDGQQIDRSSRDIESAQFNERGNSRSESRTDNLGGREAGGNAGTGGVSTNDVGSSRGSKQERIER